MIKVSRISYEKLNKEVLLDVILKSENNSRMLVKKSTPIKHLRRVSERNTERKILRITESNKYRKIERDSQDFTTKRKSNINI